MATADDVKKLAALARIAVSDDELAKFATEFDAILSYIGQLERLELPKRDAPKKSLLPHTNIMREDGEPHEKEKYTEEIAAQFPSREGNYLSVKKIISYD